MCGYFWFPGVDDELEEKEEEKEEKAQRRKQKIKGSVLHEQLQGLEEVGGQCPKGLLLHLAKGEGRSSSEKPGC